MLEKVKPRRVIIESPYAGEVRARLTVWANVRYARFCARDSLVNYGEAPFLSHLLYTQPNILNDRIPEERARGIEAGLIWGELAELTVVYFDLGYTDGMQEGIKRARLESREIQTRRLPPDLWRAYLETKTKGELIDVWA